MTTIMPCKSELVNDQAHRMLSTFGFSPHGNSLAKVLTPDVHPITNLEALTYWINEHIRKYYLPLDHTLSSQLDRCILPLIRYCWPERYQRLLYAA